MRWGLRLQLLVLLAVLLLLSYLPLAFAVATYTHVGLEQLQQDNARKLGRSVATHLAELRGHTREEAFVELARAQIEQQSVHALTLYDEQGRPIRSLGDPDLLRPLQDQSLKSNERQVRTLRTQLGPALLFVEPSPRGSVGATIRFDPQVTGASELVRLLGLYLGVSALALIAALYFALTRLIVRPILTLEAAADRVVGGARRLSAPSRAPREVMHLGHRLAQMTDRLLSEEEQLRAKVVEVEAKTRELEQAQGSLVRSERLATVGRLAAGLAHEVGNPISALMGLQDLMIEGGLSKEEQLDFLQRMRKETARIDRVIADLLAYARPSKDRTQSSASTGGGSVREAVSDVLSLLGPQKNFADMAISTKLFTGADRVELAQQELTQIVMNLMMNAADACEYRGKICISSESDDQRDSLVLVIEDDGPGIHPDLREQIFEPFVSTKDVGKGTGLGLSVTKGMVEGVGGSIVARDAEGGGARFELVLPKRPS